MKKRARIIMIINVIVINGLILAALAVLLIMGRRVDVHTDKNVEGLSAELQEVFCLAGLSPSSHNIQSWIIDVYGNENRVEIQIDPKRNLSVVDPGERGKPVKFPGIVSPNRVAVQALRDSVKGRDMSVCSFFVKYEHFLSKILPHKWIMKIWLSGIKDYV